MEKFILAAIGGGLLVYGILQKNKKIKDVQNQFVDLPDPAAQTEGNIAIFLGVIMLLGLAI